MFGSRRACLVGLACASLIVLAAVLSVSAEDPANPFFRAVWERTDKPVADGLTSRTWQWGPAAITGSLREPYAESPGGTREVQYYDKSRMEITHPDTGNPDTVWFVTNGLLVNELISGRMQLGDATFEQHAAATLNVAGDADDTLGPTYASLAGLLSAAPLSDGAPITQTVTRDGSVGSDGQFAVYGVSAAQRVTVPGIDHQIASPFWSFMNATGPVLIDGALTEALLFENPYFATGLPITEAYWTRINVAGTVKPVLLQCFERRCLTYTPDNPPGWQVEQGNVGQHYYQWRYGSVEPTPGATTAATEPSASVTATNPGPAATATASAATTVLPTATSPAGYEYVAKFGLPSDPTRNMAGPVGVAVDSLQNFYVVDALANRVQKFDPDARFVLQWGASGAGNGQFALPFAVAVDASDNVYVADLGNHRVQKFDQTGQFLLAWGKQGTLDGEFESPTAIAFDALGNVYVSDADNDRIQKFNPAGQFLSKFGGSGSADGKLDSPQGLAVDAVGNIYVVDSGNQRVQVFDANGVFVRKWGVAGTAAGQFDTPVGIVVSAAEQSVYVSDSVNNTVLTFDVNGLFQASIGVAGAGVGQLNGPRGLGILSGDVLLVADTANKRIDGFLRTDGSSIATITGDGVGRFLAPAGIDIAVDERIGVVDTALNQVKIWYDPALPSLEWGFAVLMAPRDLAFDSNSDVFVTDSGHHRVVKFDPTGKLVGGWGMSGAGEGQFNSPQGIAVDDDNNVYVVDQLNNRVQKFTRAGVFITAWGAKGTGNGQFDEPLGIAIFEEFVFVTEKGNQRVQQFDLDGVYIRQWGSFGAGAGAFNVPTAIDVDSLGYLYVADSGNQRVQKFTPTGEYVLQFGTFGTGNGEFRTPLGIAVSSEDNQDVFVTDSENARVQVFRGPQIPQ